ncbi:MAG: oligosaccharide flippase family protein [Oscillospiraceae bacterium]|nr:oligosaccharide flippase family protein [Oscillospiraceae bacterium]
MNRYKKLMTNTFIIGIGTFSSKVLVFLMMPLYTRLMTNSDYGIADLLLQTSNLLLPLASLGITDAVVRFGLEKSEDKSDVFSTGVITTICGFLMLLLFAPLLNKVKFISGHTMLVYAFVLMSSLRSLCSQFVRARQMIKLYALDGLLSTASTLGITILLLAVMHLGVTGYILAIVIADACSAVFLFLAARLHRYIRFKGIKRDTVFSMIRYSLPLIPTSVLWWVTNVSDRYLVSYMVGSGANGLYAVSYKIPTLIILISGIFIDAWQLSAVMESSARERFFTRVFDAYQSIIFLAAACIIPLSKVFTRLLVSNSFYLSWRYIPFLVMATSFSCFVTFLGSIYMVKKKSVMTMITTVAAAGMNIGLNFVLIPIYGADGAAFSTFISYFTVFIIRAFHTRSLIKIEWNVFKQVVNTLLLLAQCLVMIGEMKHWILYEALMVALMIALNAPIILGFSKQLFREKLA